MPIVRDGKLLAVLDLDSPTPARFDAEDEAGCVRLAAIMAISAVLALFVRWLLGPRRLVEEAHTIDGLSVAVLMVFAIPLMDGIVARAVADLGGAHSNIMVPLRSDAAFLGAISVFRREVRPFSDKQIALLQKLRR